MNTFTQAVAKRSRGILLSVGLSTLCSVAFGVRAEEAAKPVPVPAPAPVAIKPAPPVPIPPPVRPAKANPAIPAVQKIGPGMFSLGDIQISKASQSISFPVLVNMNKGLLEYLLVRTGGKTHESLFRTNVDPVQLQMALLLIGLEGTDRPLTHQGDAAAPKGNPVEISVHYLKDGKMQRLKPETWIAKRSEGALVDSPPLQWVFTGSVMGNGKFMAQAEGSLVALYHDPVALIDNASQGGESDRVWFVNEGAVPPVGTPATLVIRSKN